MRHTSEAWLRLTKRAPNHGFDGDPFPEKTAAYYAPLPPRPPSSGYALAKRAKEQARAGAPLRLNRPRLVR